MPLLYRLIMCAKDIESYKRNVTAKWDVKNILEYRYRSTDTLMHISPSHRNFHFNRVASKPNGANPAHFCT